MVSGGNRKRALASPRLAHFRSLPLAGDQLHRDEVTDTLLRRFLDCRCVNRDGGRLAVAERMGPRRKQLSDVSGRDGLVVGLAYVLALIPGVSRSGSTLTASLLDGWRGRCRPLFISPRHSGDHRWHRRAEGCSGCDGRCRTAAPRRRDPGGAVVSWLAIDWLLKFLQRHSTWLFVAYRLLFGVGLLAWWSIHGAH